MNFPKIFLTRWARLAGILSLAILATFTFSSSALAESYPAIGGDKNEFDLVVNLKGDASKVTKVVAKRSVPAHDEKDEDFNAVHTYNLVKDSKNTSQWKQSGFDFGQDGISCREMINQKYNTLYDEDKGWFNFTVIGYNSSNKPITPETSVVFDIRDDCGRDKAVDINVLASAVDSSTRGVLNGTITIIERGKEVGVTNLKIQLRGPGSSQALKSPSTISADKKTFKFTDITPGTYTLFGQAGCTSTQTGGCSTSGTINTTGEIKAGNNKNDIIIDEGKVTFCGDGCNKSTILNNTSLAAANTPTAAENASNNDAPDCESNAGPFGWIICKVIDGLASASDTMFTEIIEPLLETKPLDTSADSGNYQIWSNFRIFGNIFLVIALLVIVFGQSIGGGLIEAYSAKKILPRLLIAAILINLSLYLVAFAVDVTNVLGRGVGALIELPFRQPPPDEFAIQMGPASSSIGLFALVGAGGAIWATGVAAFIPWLFFTVLIPLFLVFVAILAVVIIRNGLIIFLILVAPVAFALYCLPNTEKYFKQWWDLLWKTLLIYPIIAIIFAIANVLSVIMSQTNTSFGPLLSVIALVIPLFAIPFAFKLAGGVMSRVADVATGSTAKVNGMMKGRKEQSAFRAKQARAGRMMGAASRFNESDFGKRVGVAPIIGKRIGTASQRLSQRNASLAADYAKTAGAQATQHDDEAIRAQTYDNYNDAVSGLTQRYMSKGMSEPDARRDAIRAASAANAAGGYGRSQAMFAAEAMAKTGTSFDYGDQEDMAETIARASGGNASTISSLVGNMNSTTKQVGRHDLAAGFGTMNDMAQAKAGLKTVSSNIYSEGAENAWNSASLSQHANDKPQNIKAHIAHFEKMLNNPSATDAQKEKAVTFFNELRVMSPYASGEVQEKIAEAWDRNDAKIAMTVDKLPPTAATGGVRTVSEPIERQVPQPDGSFLKVVDQTRPAQVLTGPETAQERIARNSRTFERIDPARK